MSISQLNGAKELARNDPLLYPQVVNGVLNIADHPEADLRRWAANFLNEAFTAPTLPTEDKIELALQVLDALKTLISDSDALTAKFAVTCLCIIYPMLFKHICLNPSLFDSWNKIEQLKKQALALWPNKARRGVQVACIKLAQIIVLVQSKQQVPGDEVSLSTVIPGHPILDPVYLSAESQGLLDRLLESLGERELSVITFQATINSLLSLFPKRPSFSPKIMQAIISCQISRKEIDCSPDAVELALRSLDKLLQLNLRWAVQTGTVPQLKDGVQRYLSQLSAFRASSNLRKRALESDDSPNGGGKRKKLDLDGLLLSANRKLGPGRVSYTKLYELDGVDSALSQFDARDLPLDVAIKVALAGVSTVNTKNLMRFSDIVKARYEGTEVEVVAEAATISGTEELVGEERDVKNVFDSQPDSQPDSQSDSQSDSHPEVKEPEPEEPEILPTEEELEGQKLLIAGDQDEAAKDLFKRILTAFDGTSGLSSDYSIVKLDTKLLSEITTDSWVYIVSRISSRGVDMHNSMARTLRSQLYTELMKDFRSNLDKLVIWITEEWYAEKMLASTTVEEGSTKPSIYWALVGKIIDQILPKVEVNDSKFFIRFMSEIPELNEANIKKLRSLCNDPERSVLGTRVLKFLIMFKPTVRTICVEFAESLAQQGVTGLNAIIAKFKPAS